MWTISVEVGAGPNLIFGREMEFDRVCECRLRSRAFGVDGPPTESGRGPTAKWAIGVERLWCCRMGGEAGSNGLGVRAWRENEGSSEFAGAALPKLNDERRSATA